ncbi:2OG-Fe(II) oxygenase [Nocardia nova]|uniref:2OG-Fe(II) oxygenase n=1 Tax=Nocardia nova TaxID=37330 RepID=UPI0033D721DB
MHTPEFDQDGRPPGIGNCVIEEVVCLDGELAAVRVRDLLADDYARALGDHLHNRIVYEQDIIGDTKQVSRAARSDDMPDSPIVTTAPATPVARAALKLLSDPWWLRQLSRWTGSELQVLRPSTPYRMDADDFVDPHDDCPAPEYRMSVSLNLTPDWQESDGGPTVVGLVDRVEEYDHPDWPIPLSRWTLGSKKRTLNPQFNSALLLPLSPHRAHAVLPVRRGPRYSITTLYGTVAAA